MPKNDFINLPVPDLPNPRYVGRGYFSIAYYVFEPDSASDFGAMDESAEDSKVDEFDPVLEPDYFLEFGYPEPSTAKKPSDPHQKTIVLCHGLAAGGLQFANDARFFAKQGFRVIVPDLRAHGQSKIPELQELSINDFTIEIMANDLLAILDKEGVEQTHWVGNSLGGILALYILGSEPGRIVDLVTFGASFTLQLSSFLIPTVKFVSKFMRRQHQDELIARMTTKNPDARAIIYQMLKSANRESVYLIAENLTNYDLLYNALESESAILMLRPLGDIMINQAQKEPLEIMQKKSNFFVKDIANAGHCANLEQPQIVREEILDFVGGGWVLWD